MSTRNVRSAVIIVSGVVATCVFPINFYLWWRVLHLIGATPLMWFLFWVNLPVVTLLAAVGWVLKNAVVLLAAVNRLSGSLKE
jgi:hypothetical protein